MCILTMFSTLLVVYTAYCALQIVQLTLHYWQINTHSVPILHQVEYNMQ